MSYQRDEVKAPTVSGLAFRALVKAFESAVGPLLLKKIMNDSGLERWRSTSAGNATPIQQPLPRGAEPTERGTPAQLALRATRASTPTSGERVETTAAFAAAYAKGERDPVMVVRRIHQQLELLEGGDEKMGFFIARKPEEVLAAAEASAARHRKKAPLSVLDGVPVVVKDELDVEGFPTTLGTRIFHAPAQRDAVVVARLKAAGAIILGKANMNELGVTPIGLNPHWGAARNPWNRGHITGGSSSGPASTVAAGLAPISIGADGGGSVRIPAALCGVVGLKATFGRIPETGVAPLCWNVGHVGPLGATVADVAAAYALIAGPDAGDAVSWSQPPVHLSGFEDASLEGLRLGICGEYFDDAHGDVVARCRQAVRALTDAGATVVELPAPDLNTVLWSHTAIILSEMLCSMRSHYEQDKSRFALATRTNLALAAQFTATDLVHAMRHRHRLTKEALELMKGVDVIVTPTTAMTAPPIVEDTLPEGDSNLQVVDALMRFVRLANLTGFPALSVPAGYDAAGLPVGVQLMGRPYEEHMLLRMGRVVEAAAPRRTPPVHVNAL